MPLSTGVIFLLFLAITIAITVLCCLITNGSGNKKFKKYGHIKTQRELYQLQNNF